MTQMTRMRTRKKVKEKKSMIARKEVGREKRMGC